MVGGSAVLVVGGMLVVGSRSLVVVAVMVFGWVWGCSDPLVYLWIGIFCAGIVLIRYGTNLGYNTFGRLMACSRFLATVGDGVGDVSFLFVCFFFLEFL